MYKENNKYRYDGTYFICDMRIMGQTDLTLTSKILLNYMYGFWDNGLNFFASNNACSVMLGVSIRSINNAIKELKDKQYIHCEYRKDEQNNVLRIITKYEHKKREKSTLLRMFESVSNQIAEYKEDIKND